MHYISLCVEQLDLSVKQLQFNDPSYDRFSLILTDNIVELILHRQCERLISFDASLRFTQKYSDTTRKKALGQEFKEKTKFCKNEKLLSEEEQIFINICHQHRNALYHIGIKYNDMIHSLAIVYHQLGCELFKRLKPNGFMLPSPKKKYSEAVEKHINPSKDGFDIFKAPDDACISLSKDRPDLPAPFPQVLSTSALNALEKIEEQLDSLVSDDPQGHSEEQIIFDVQLWNFLQSTDTIEEAEKLSGDKFNDFFEARKYLEKNWSSPIKRNPIPKWKTRAENFKKENNNYTCLINYNSFRNDIFDFENAVDKAAFALDLYIQEETDRALGK